MYQWLLCWLHLSSLALGFLFTGEYARNNNVFSLICLLLHPAFGSFSGDQDSVLPLTGTRVVINGMAKELGLKTTIPYRSWFNGNQVSSLIIIIFFFT